MSILILIRKLLLTITINKIQQIQTVLKNMDKAKTLEALLRCHEITPEDFFQTQGIAQQIRNNLQKFIKYCKTHRTFARRMIALALNIPYTDLEDLKIKTASHAITEVLSNEEAAIAELFFEEQAKINADSTDIPEELDGGIQSEAERLFKFDSEDEETEEERPVELEKDEIAALSLEILLSPEKNTTCLGHLHKIYSFLIRHNSLPVLQYFQEHNASLQLLLTNLRYSSVSSLVAQLLTSEDKSRQYVYEGLKRSIIQHTIEEIFSKIEDEDFFDGIMILVEEILNTTKQSYYEYFQDFKRVSNLLVNKEIMARFLEIILSRREKSFRSASRFLEFLFSRINSQREDNSYYHRGQETEPSMNFEVDIFFEKVPALLQQIEHIQKFSNLTKISYCTFLEALLNSSKFKSCTFLLSSPEFIGLLDSLTRQEKSGIYKNKLYNLITVILNKATSEEISLFLQSNEKVWDYFTSVRSANYANTKIYNKNESSAYDVALISQLSKKNENVISLASKAIGKDFKRICKKYDTKIASFQSSASFSLEEESTFEQFNFDSNNKESNIPSFSLNFVGKNSISIPILQLPERNHSEEESKERGERQEFPSLNGIKEIIEIEEVVSLNDETIKTLTMNDREDCHIERPPELIRNEKCLSDSPERPRQNPQQKLQGAEKQVPVIKVKDKNEIHVDQVRFFTKHLAIFA